MMSQKAGNLTYSPTWGEFNTEPVLYQFNLRILLRLISDVSSEVSGSPMNKKPSGHITKFVLILPKVVTQLFNIVLRRGILLALNNYCSIISIDQEHVQPTAISE